VSPAETAKVLAAAAAFDQRTVGTADVAAWHSALGELDYADARDAVTRHYRTTADRIMPVHVLHYAGEIRSERAQRDWEQTHGHAYVGDGTVCDACGLPPANRRHSWTAKGAA